MWMHAHKKHLDLSMVAIHFKASTEQGSSLIFWNAVELIVTQFRKI